MKVKFTQNYEVQGGGHDGLAESEAIQIERAKRGMFPKGVEAIYRKGDVVELSESSAHHFIRRGVAELVTDPKVEAKTPEQIKREVQAERKAQFDVAERNHQKAKDRETAKSA